jgi:DNA-directed RNA polymerase specialized sigma24 family protein
MTTEELGELVARAALQEATAETALYERYQRFVRRRLGETKARRNWFWLTDLDSAVQDVFTQFFLSLRDGKFHYEGQRRLEGFLLRTSFFVAMNLKDRAREEQVLSIFDPEDGGLRFDMASFADAVYDQVDRQRCLKLLGEAVNSLNENRREVIERTLLGQKVREICSATERSPASVSGLKFNALVELRKKLEQVGFLGHCAELFGLGSIEVDNL